MSSHLSSEQFAKCFVGESTGAELQHIRECPECSAALDRFGNTISSFQKAIRDRIDVRVAAQEPGRFQAPFQPATAVRPNWRHALAIAAVVLLGMLPFLMSEMKPDEVTPKTSAQTSADALMDAINLHLSRTIPSPMEPMIFLIPTEESASKLGGVQ